MSDTQATIQAKGTILLPSVLGCTMILFAALPFLVFMLAPIESTMGFVQKMFYIHVPCAWAMLLGAVFSGVSGARYLASRRDVHFRRLVAASELTILFGLGVMVTGPLWARVAWGHYWVWDARLTTVFVLFLLAIATLIVAQFAAEGGKAVACAMSLFGLALVPLIYSSVQIWKTIHPKTSVVPKLGLKMGVPFWVGSFAFIGLFLVMFWLRSAIATLEENINILYRRQ